MKKLILIALASVFTSAAYADRTVAVVHGTDPLIKNVRLTEAGLLKVVQNDGTKSSMQLSAANAGTLVGLARSLSGAEIATEHRQFICMMFMAEMHVQTLSVLNFETGKMTPTLSH